MIKKLITLFVLFILISNYSFSQEEARLLRFPSISENAIVFTYAGDLYTVDINGGTARRLTSHEGYEMFAKFSPDGKSIAFTGQYDGNTEVFKIPCKGGDPERLTITATLNRDDVADRMGPNNIVMAWTPDGDNVIYRSRKQTFNSFVGQLFMVEKEGGMSSELPLPTGGFCSYSADGNKLAYNRVFREFRTWKYYRGGMADDIWIYDFKTKKTINITNNIAQDIFPMWYGKEIYFISDRDRIMNLFCYNTETKETKKVTNFTEYDIKFPSIGGNKIVFENGGYIYVFNITTQRAEKISISISNENEWARMEMVDPMKFYREVDLSPDGKRLIVQARGDIYSVPAENGITYNLTNSPGAHDRQIAWSPNGKYIAWVSDMNGEFEIYMQKHDGSEKPIQLTKNADTYKFEIEWSPDSKKIVWGDKKMRVRYIDIDSKKITEIDKSKLWEIRHYKWSPDSKWLTYSKNAENGFGIVYLYSIDKNKSYPVTDDWYSSSSPVFSTDGKYLLFSSKRSFNSIYSETEWNHVYRDMSKMYLVTLAKETESPFAPENDTVEIKDDSEKDTKDEGDNGEKSDDIIVDLDNIGNRIVAIPTDDGYYWNISAIDNKVYYNYWKTKGKGSAFKMYDLAKKKETELGNGLGYVLSGSNKKMLITKGKKVSVVGLPSGKVDMKETVDFSNVKVWVDKEQEWKQIFDESWRQMRDFFYVENMHGVDWQKMHDKYAVLLPYVKHRKDLNYIIGELIGELNVGHAYVNGGDSPKPKRIKVGLLGAKLSKHSSGYVQVDEIINGANWSKKLRSPLTEIGVGVEDGDFILAVNGKSTKEMKDIFESLIGTAGKQVELTVNSKASEKDSRKVLVVPLADESSLYYYNWVQNNIRKVSDATDGQVGYIHVPDMSTAGLDEFVKYFYPQLKKKALIIDDRGNGGGNVSPMIIERLKREITRANMVRNVEEPGQTPRQIHLGPKVLLLNNYSASDGDLFPYSFKKHNIGKTIGVRSWGGVVGIRGSLPFIDGADLRKPEFASYSSDESKWIIEGHGVEPDIIVDNDPAKEYAGIDEQLNKAIEVVLEELENWETKIPPIPVGPDKSK